MKNLLKIDFYLLRKNFLFKLLIALGVVFTAFSISQGVMFTNIGQGRDLSQNTPGGGPQMPGGNMPAFDTTGKSIFTSSFSLSISFAMIVAVVLALLVAAQFINGNVRNKIIAGNKKSTVYFSLITVHVVAGIALLFAYAVLRLTIGSWVLGYDGETAFSGGDFLYTLQVLSLSLLVYVAIFSIAVWLATLTRATGTAILCVIGFVLLLSFTSNIYMLISDWTWLETVCEFNFTNMLSTILESELSWVNWLIIIGGSLAFSALAIFGGAYLFEKQDVK